VGWHTKVICHQLLALQRLLRANSYDWWVHSEGFVAELLPVLGPPYTLQLEHVEHGDGVAEDILDVDVAKGERDEEDLQLVCGGGECEEECEDVVDAGGC